ncbi:hypothetical protein HKCCSP123_08060 [Rhodobacterales bacterium HKCCSP123]|nr:hypothetical protein [Rhodobacterales bacterium HKCCSP123]
MTDRTAAKAGRPAAHTELRRQHVSGDTDTDKVRPGTGGGEAVTSLKPRTPAERVPADGDEDDLFNDMPV